MGGDCLEGAFEPTADAANEPPHLERDQDGQGVRDRDPGGGGDGTREHRSGKRRKDLAFVCRELWGHYRARPFTNATPIWPAVFRRLEQIKFSADLAQLSEKELALLQAIAADGPDEFNPAPFVQQFHYQYFKRLAEAGLLIRTGRGRYRLYHTLFREFLRQTK